MSYPRSAPNANGTDARPSGADTRLTPGLALTRLRMNVTEREHANVIGATARFKMSHRGKLRRLEI